MAEPLEVRAYGNVGWEIQDASGRVAVVYGGSLERARTMAAAPQMLEACLAAVVYDDAIRSCANDPEKMTEFGTAEGDDLDALYLDWMTKSRAAIASARVSQAEERENG